MPIPVDEALNAALIVMETAACPGFDGRDGELEKLLSEGLSSKELTEEEFWSSVDAKTNAILAGHKLGRGRILF